MSSENILAERLVFFLVHPLTREKPVEFNKQLLRSQRVLISLPGVLDASARKSVAEAFADLFPEKKITLIEETSGNDAGSSSILPVVIRREERTFRQLWKSPAVGRIKDEGTDVFIDLYSDFSLLGIYICRLLHPAVRITFPKPFSRRYYNLEYCSKQKDDMEKKIRNLINFLSGVH